MIVWLAWFTDSIALWRHQKETPYLLDEGQTHTGPNMEAIFNALHAEPETEDWAERRTGSREGSSSLELGEINWNDINDEVDAAMNESDDEDERSVRSGNVSDEDDWTDESNSMIRLVRGLPSFRAQRANITDLNSSANTTPKVSHKRLRSVTPSEVAVNGGGGGASSSVISSKDDDSLRSPLAKRKKLAAERTGYSKLKEAISADDLKAASTSSDSQPGEVASHGLTVVPEGSDDNEDDEGEDEEDEDDFLARELEEEWG
jgi:RNA polymerase II subunit A C-terminal domain phosphatase